MKCLKIQFKRVTTHQLQQVQQGNAYQTGPPAGTNNNKQIFIGVPQPPPVPRVPVPFPYRSAKARG